MPARSPAEWGRPSADGPGTGGPAPVEVLIPCYRRTEELAVTLAGLAGQTDADFDVVLSDQSEGAPVWDSGAVAAMLRILRAQGRRVNCHRNLPRRGMAHQRHTLLSRAHAARVLFLDDDVWLAPRTLTRMDALLTEHGGGFIGSAVQGLSFLDDVRPDEWQSFATWDGPVRPERMAEDAPGHGRWTLHNAANLTHIAAQRKMGADETLAYRVAWVGACVLFDREALLDSGGYAFWDDLPAQHAGEDVLAQWQVMARHGGAGMLPSGAVHLETATTIEDRRVDAAATLAAHGEP